MRLYNLKHPEQEVNYSQAVQLGLGRDRGLFFPRTFPKLKDVSALFDMNFVQRSQKILGAWLNEELGEKTVNDAVEKAFNFPVKVEKVDEKRLILELFHGPTLAFKDFGARFMAQCISLLAADKPITILTATSGDTGAAVANAFHGLQNINVVVLYPEGKISLLQEKMFCTTGDNIHTIAINSDFDACQTLVKQAFSDEEMLSGLHLNSANSINISRLLAQICYYFEAVSVHRKHFSAPPVISVPSGNFGNLTAGLFACAMGLPVKRFIAATNSNDTIPRYLHSGKWEPFKTVATTSNAMDVSDPSNWPRVEALCSALGWPLNKIEGISISETSTRESLVSLYKLGYLSEPHASIAARALEQSLHPGESGIFLGTAHPAKFKDTVEETLGINIPLPLELQVVAEKPILSARLDADFASLKKHLLKKLL